MRYHCSSCIILSDGFFVYLLYLLPVCVDYALSWVVY